MKYSYRIDASANAAYLKMAFDRNISSRYISFSNIFTNFATPAQMEMMRALNKTPGTIEGHPDATSGGGLISFDGNTITIQINQHLNMAETVKRLVKKVQRRIAKGESRKRISHDTILANIERLNGK